MTKLMKKLKAPIKTKPFRGPFQQGLIGGLDAALREVRLLEKALKAKIKLVKESQ